MICIEKEKIRDAGSTMQCAHVDRMGPAKDVNCPAILLLAARRQEVLCSATGKFGKLFRDIFKGLYGFAAGICLLS
jgi:hypothetical protein